MKTTLLSVAVAAALSITTLAHAAGPDNESVKISAPVATDFKFKPQEFSDYLYSYQLSNGERLRFTQKVAHYYAQLDGQKKVEIFPVAPGEFVTHAGTRISFADAGFELTIDNYERLPMSAQRAAQLPAGTTVVATR
ncbi:gel scht [Pseudoduganella sp. FT55W]|uniref:Gel scht n=1 Tax=Duganella rivi TaxID=2666083 RepID=A0A7X4GUJ8_9BURK|nr:gel scht [Duganella rivi]MYM69988.1 gel scht [Duganella rivi]